tara:strand:+ start:655 stop:885 length:231 start_codon:yes stop_codon:yes gene_type:complete
MLVFLEEVVSESVGLEHESGNKLNGMMQEVSEEGFATKKRSGSLDCEDDFFPINQTAKKKERVCPKRREMGMFRTC